MVGLSFIDMVEILQITGLLPALISYKENGILTEELVFLDYANKDVRAINFPIHKDLKESILKQMQVRNVNVPPIPKTEDLDKWKRN